MGSYDLHLVKDDGGWKIDKFKFNLKFRRRTGTWKGKRRSNNNDGA
jgi:hypothetical protein